MRTFSGMDQPWRRRSDAGNRSFGSDRV